MNAAEAIDALRALHHPVERLRCGARSTETVKHYHGNVEERELICTKDPHPADEPHKDAICCWRFHRFTAGTPVLEDVWGGRNCACGQYDCKTRAILDAIEATPESSTIAEEKRQWRVRDTAWGGDRMGVENSMRHYQRMHGGVLESRRAAGDWREEGNPA